MRGDVTKNICEYMNTYSLAGRVYRLLEIKIIRESIRTELIIRTRLKLKIRSRTNTGKHEINKRICKIVNESFENIKITPEDVELYKRCRIKELEQRTGKCAWGFPDVRKRYGFNPITGLEESD